MTSRSFFRLIVSAGALSVFTTAPLTAGAPDWLRAVAATPMGSYEAGTPAVVLLDETTITVKDNGEMANLHRRALRILTPQGRNYGIFASAFDGATRISGLAGWSISAQGKELDVKSKDAIESRYSPDNLYDDARRIILRIPGADSGSVVGYEYEQKERPLMLQDIHRFQEEIPVLRARLTVQLPHDWEFRASWRNHADVAPREEGSKRWTWELENVPPIKAEPFMPSPPTVAARLFLNLFPPRENTNRVTSASWREIGAWYNQLTADRRVATPGIHDKVVALTEHASWPIDQIQRLTSFVQRDIRYVAIEIGIGGFQPHPAGDVFVSRYGDCKDKATLLAAMLREVNVESYYVLVNTDRGVIDQGFPTARTFNHVILAFRPPEDPGVKSWASRVVSPSLGQLALFDPTDPVTPLGSLPAGLQAGAGLLVTSGGGEILRLPLAPPSANQMLRKAQLRLDGDGALSGDVEETYLGEPAARRRSLFRETAGMDRAGHIEKALAPFLDGHLQKAALVNLAYPEVEFGINYSFKAPNYARRAGDLLLVRARVLGQKSGELPAADRRYPITFAATREETDSYEIAIPDGYAIDELPPAVQVEYPFGSYVSRTEAAGNLIRYHRTFLIRQLTVAPERLSDLSQFYRQIEADERASVVLKHQ